jgi:hypothetical protein
MEAGGRVIIAFGGRDAAGKSGTIRALSLGSRTFAQASEHLEEIGRSPVGALWKLT